MDKDTRLELRLERDLKRAAEAEAKRRGQSLSEMIRAYLKRASRP